MFRYETAGIQNGIVLLLIEIRGFRRTMRVGRNIRVRHPHKTLSMGTSDGDKIQKSWRTRL
jgi:hypothetical protein